MKPQFERVLIQLCNQASGLFHTNKSYLLVSIDILYSAIVLSTYLYAWILSTQV